MNNTRSKFEEIWPVPECIYWSDKDGQYMIKNGRGSLGDCLSYESKLEIFTSCQEATDVYVGVVDELVSQMQMISELSLELQVVGIARESIGRAKQKLEQIK